MSTSDYSRIWRRLKPRELDRRLTQAIDRWTAGETLEQIAATWGASGSTLCRVLLAHAPTEWRQALVARAYVKFEQAKAQQEVETGNIARARAQVALARWHLEWALKKLASVPLRIVGRELRGACPDCGEPGQVFASSDRAHCYVCGWDGAAVTYVKAAVGTTAAHSGTTADNIAQHTTAT